MDGLALLCNLFADGPVTLRRLRPHVPDLATLERTPAEFLAEWIQCSVPQARAFAEEGAILRHRIGEREPDRPLEQVVLEAEPASPAEAFFVHGGSAEEATLEPLAPTAFSWPAPAPSHESVLAPAPTVAESFAGFGRRPIEREPEPEVEVLPALPESVTEVPRPLSPSALAAGESALRVDPDEGNQDHGRTLLRPGLLPSLDAHSCVRLAEHGVRTVRALAEGAGLALSRRTEIPYSRLLGFARSARCLLRGENEASFESTVALRPSVPRPGSFASVSERAHDPFALPLEEPESAGPFG